MVRASGPAAVFAVAVIVAACSGNPLASSAPATAAPGEASAWQPENAWQRALGAIGEDGHFSLQAALDLFATAFGPVPGSTTTQDLTGIFDLTIAVNAVMAHEDELTAEQRTAIDRYLEIPADATTIVVESSADGGPTRGIQLVEITAERTAKLKAAAAGFRQTYKTGLGFDIPYMEIVWAPRPASVKPIGPGIYPNGGAGASFDGPDGQNDRGRITIYNEASGEVDSVLESLLAHEVFHCFQYAGYGTLAKFKEALPWIIEGQASWAGQVIGGPSGKYDPFWNEYLLVPTKPLITRTYDAIGFYGHLQRQFELGGSSPEQAIASMWPKLKAMWGAGGNNVAAFEASGAGETAFLDSWASGVTRKAPPWEAWNTSGPGITTSAYKGPAILIPADVKPVAQSAFTNQVWQLQLTTDLVHFLTNGDARLHDGAIDTTALDDVWYCVAGHDCKPNPDCPDAFPVPTTAGTINSSALLAVTGGTSGTAATIRGVDVLDTCPSLAPPSSPNPLFKATVQFAYGRAPMTGGWCKVGPALGAHFFNLWFVGPDKDFFDIAIESTTPIVAGTYADPWFILSTLRQGDFWENLKLAVVTLEGTTESGAFIPTGGSFAGHWWGGERGDVPISGRFDCFGDETDFDWATGVLNYGSINANGDPRTVSLDFSATSDADGSNPTGTVTLTSSDFPTVHTPWAEVDCLTVIGNTFGLVARTTRALSSLESVGLPPELRVPVSTFLFFGGTQDDVSPDRDPAALEVVSGAGSCAPTMFALDHQESAIAVHDAP
jgi:hypothetical protein